MNTYEQETQYNVEEARTWGTIFLGLLIALILLVTFCSSTPAQADEITYNTYKFLNPPENPYPVPEPLSDEIVPSRPIVVNIIGSRHWHPQNLNEPVEIYYD